MKHNKAIIVSVVLLVVAAVAVLGLSRHPSPGDNAGRMSSASAVATDKVTISNYMFSPMIVKVKVGTTVTWTNTDTVNHTVTADSSSADAPSSMDIPQGKAYHYTFKQTGTFTYHCFPHPYMHGTIEVTE